MKDESLKAATFQIASMKNERAMGGGGDGTGSGASGGLGGGSGGVGVGAVEQLRFDMMALREKISTHEEEKRK